MLLLEGCFVSTGFPFQAARHSLSRDNESQDRSSEMLDRVSLSLAGKQMK